MSDIAERLRSRKITGLYGNDRPDDWSIHVDVGIDPLCYEAADEIERLRAELEGANDKGRRLFADLEAAESKNQELLAQVGVLSDALENLVRLFKGYQGMELKDAQEALASLPAEAKKMLEVVEAAKKLSKTDVYEVEVEDGPPVLTRAGLDALDAVDEALHTLDQ